MNKEIEEDDRGTKTSIKKCIKYHRRRKEIMKTIAELEKLMEEAIEYWKDKDKYKADFLQCLLEISKNNNINGHKYVYAILESYGRDEAGYDFAEVKLYIKYN